MPSVLLFLLAATLAWNPASASAFPNNIVAVVNGVPISEVDFDLSVSQNESMDPQRFLAMAGEKTGRGNVADRLSGANPKRASGPEMA